MSTSRLSSIAVVAGVMLAAGIVTWLTRAAEDRQLEERPPAVPSRAKPAVTPIAPVAALPVKPDEGGAASVAPPEQVMYAQQRQDAKISRGLASNPGGGILVEDVPEGSVASQLRVVPGDVIVAINAEPVSSPDQFAQMYREQGLPRQMTVIHDGREMHHH